MRSLDEKTAYQLQRKYQLDKRILAYKVGASNYRSAKFFNYTDVIVGSICADNVYFNAVPMDYSVAELEVVVKVLITDSKIGAYATESFHLGIECPFISVDNEHGDARVCIADNCSSGDLLIFDSVEFGAFTTVNIFSGNELKAVGNVNNLLWSVDEIVERTFDVIRVNNLPINDGHLYIASGGITEVFGLIKNENLRFEIE